MELFHTIFTLIEYILESLIIYGVLILIERSRPIEPNQPFKHIFFNLQWSIIYILFGAAIEAIGIGVLIEITQNLLSAPYFSLPVSSNLLAKISRILFYLFIIDFFYYTQ